MSRSNMEIPVEKANEKQNKCRNYKRLYKLKKKKLIINSSKNLKTV